VKDTQYADYEAALRVLKAIKDHKHPLRVDALALRLWAGSSSKRRPLAEIAVEIVKAENSQPGRYAPTPGITQITGPDSIVFWANTTAVSSFFESNLLCFPRTPRKQLLLTTGWACTFGSPDESLVLIASYCFCSVSPPCRVLVPRGRARVLPIEQTNY
jgi:hypothetical protein